MQSTLKIVIFLALISLALQLGFQCNINNCQSCSYPNFCGQCNNNYLLTLNNASGDFYCQAVTCAANCMTCYQNNTCQTCNTNFFLTANGACSTNPSSISPLPQNCIWSSSTTNCSLCAYGYIQNAGSCYPIISFSSSDQNCLVKMTSSICQICQTNYIVNMFGNCIKNLVSQVCNMANCQYCQGSNSTCLICSQNFQLSPSGTCLTPTCTLQGCLSCLNPSSCQTCSPQYILTSSKTCQPIGTGCNILNCLTCSTYQSCGQCQIGYQLVQFTTIINLITNNIYLCQKISCPFNITNCNQCVYNYNNNFQYNQTLCSSTGCMTGYINVNGFCVPNISTTAITCNNVSNCTQCSFTNFCKLCQSGYSLTSLGTCQKNICNVPNCALCSLNNICSQCSPSYFLTIGNLTTLSPSTNTVNFIQFTLQQQCTYNTNILCTNPNCDYCQSNNVCAACALGYDFDGSNTNCVVTCNVQNCYTCKQTLNVTTAPCSACNPGYQLSSTGMQCTQIPFSCGSGCSNSTSTPSCIFNPMIQQGQCLQCISSMILYNGQCYSSTCNIFGCQICAPWAPTNTLCLQCKPSLVLSDGYCITPNCDNNVPNCVNCVQNGKCVGCRQGYFIQIVNSSSNTCIAQTSISSCNVENCMQCQTGNPNVCTSCATPYQVLNGLCVCGFQNCLDCSTSILTCNLCPTSLIATLQSPNCLPAPSLVNTCNVANCQACLSVNQCSICSLGYTLNTNNFTCQLNNCSALGLTNCQLCDQFGYSCHFCNTGYMIDNFLQGGTCNLINNNYTCNISGCAVCSSLNNSICSMCLPTYFSNGTTQCIPNSCPISNCYLCLNNNACTVCDSGYYLALDLTCQAKFTNIVSCQNAIQYCDICVVGIATSSSTFYCIRCQDGFQFNTATSQCMPQMNSISNCKVQLPDYNFNNLPMCIVCQQGYFVNSYAQCSLFNPNITNVGCTVYNCLYCALNSTTCSFCFTPWGISSTGICQSTAFCGNLTNCQSCINSTFCSTCSPSYLPYQGLCVSCNFVGCSYCINTGNCTMCQSGYQLNNNNGLCILCNVQNCNTCSNNNVCSQCNSSLAVSSSGNSCVTCGLNNCVSCSANNFCGICQSGYQLYQGTCVQCNSPSCLSCIGNNICGSCALGFSLISGSCVTCSYPCASCNSNNTCATCQIPLFISTPSASGTCIQSSVPNCLTYNSANTSICATCTTSYTLNTTSNICNLICNSPCLTCNPTTPNNCLSCSAGFYLINSTCIQCPMGCSTCNSASCLTCVTGFYMISNECKQCPSFCASCSSLSVCTTLIQTNQQVLVQINSQTSLAICPSTCQTCSNVNPTICLTCLEGFFLNSATNICSSCNQACKTCSGSNLNQCLSCYPNNFFINNACIPCLSPCQTCLNQNKTSTCLTCFPGSYINNNTCTSGCSVNCVTCTSSTLCSICDSGYSLFTLANSNIMCVQCTSNCRTCAAGLPGSCMSCGNGFYLSNGLCMACTTNCISCGSPTSCSGCILGYFLTSSLTCSINCALPCATCSSNNPTKCSSCIAGYTYSSLSFSCSPQTICNGACTVCPIGYLLTSGQCTKCTTANCQLCSSANLNTCVSCAQGFYLNSANNQCVACLKQCATCLRGDGCLTCNSGYTSLANVNIAGSGYQCIVCNFPCASCLNDPDYCTSCTPGYSFMGWKCSQSFYFQFSVSLLTNATVFNQNYYTFIQALAKSIGSTNLQTVTITGIKFGSVIVSGGVAPIAPSGTLQSNQQYNSFFATIATNNVISGMIVGSATISVIGGTIDYSKINLALILGITIPVLVLIIAGIVLYIYCKKRKSSDILEQKIKQQSGLTVRQSFQLSSRYKNDQTTRPFQEDTAIN